MTRDANQIAQDYARQHQQWTPPPPVPQWGEFTILSSFGDDAYVISRTPHVTVQVTPPGLIVLTHMDGGKTMFKPVEGWCMMFEPDDAEG